MKKKLIIAAVVLLAGGFAAYKTVLAKPAPEPKVHGIAYVLPKEFILNLKDGRFLKLGVGLVVAHDQELEAHGESGAPPDGYGTMPQEALVRAVVTDRLTDASADALIDRGGRHELKEAIAKDLRRHTDVKVEEVLFTDVAVQ